jgi:hypothetical protein
VAVFHPGEGRQWSWRAEYDDFHDGLPRRIHLVSADRKRFDLLLTLSQVESNVALTPDVFRVQIPPAAERITLNELRQSGPLATKSDGK